MSDMEFVALWGWCLGAALTGALARIGRGLWGDPPAAHPWPLVLGDLSAVPAIALVAALSVRELGATRAMAELASVVCGVFGPAWAIARLQSLVERKVGP